MPKCWNILTDSFWVVHQNLPKFQKLNFDENISEKLITYELWVQQHQFLEIFNKMSKRVVAGHFWPALKCPSSLGIPRESRIICPALNDAPWRQIAAIILRLSRALMWRLRVSYKDLPNPWAYFVETWYNRVGNVKFTCSNESFGL